MALGKTQQGSFSSDGSSPPSPTYPTHTAVPSLWFVPWERFLGEKLLWGPVELPAFVRPVKTQGPKVLLPNSPCFTWKSQNRENS